MLYPPDRFSYFGIAPSGNVQNYLSAFVRSGPEHFVRGLSPLKGKHCAHSRRHLSPIELSLGSVNANNY